MTALQVSTCRAFFNRLLNVPTMEEHPLESTEMKKAVAAKAAKHFGYFVETAESWNRNLAHEELNEKMGNGLVASALDLQPGASLNLAAWLRDNGYPKEALERALRLMPVMIGHLGILEMLFVHSEQGVLPTSLIESLLKSEAPLTYQGVVLTRADVFIDYRRRVLGGTVSTG